MKTWAAAMVVAATGILVAQQQPVFRTNADLVTVPVAVRANGTPVAGFKPEDFVVLDNGVPQKVDSVTGESVGADITILVETGASMKAYLGTLSEQVAKIAAMVRPNDRLEVLGVGTYVEELLPLTRAADQPALGALKIGGSLTSVNDAILAALLREPDKERPHLVIAITDTVDSMSTADMAAVRDVARESGATLVVAWTTLSVDTSGPPPDDPTKPPMWFTTSEREEMNVARTAPRARYWVPHHTPPAGRTIDKFDVMKEAAESTGGGMHPPGVFTDRTAAAIFNRIYNDYRHNYVIRYTPTGVARHGWHEITVTAPRHASYELRARRGYLVEAKPPAPDTTAVSPPPAPIDALVSAGEAGDYDAVGRIIHGTSTKRALIDEFNRRGNVFPFAPRREFVVGLQLAEMALPATSPVLQPAGYALIEKYRKLLVQVEGYDGFERYWRLAAIVLEQAQVKPSQGVLRLVNESIAKYPDEPRFVLAAAILADQEWISGDITSPAAPTRRAPEIVRRFDAAIAFDPVRAEASVRKAWYLNRMGRHAEALSLIDGAKPDPQDRVLGYWRELFRGRILDDLGRIDEAAAAFRAALAIAPNAQSARSALMAALLRSGHRREAEQEAEALQTAPANAFDPWWIYWQADYRWFPVLFSRLAEFAK